MLTTSLRALREPRYARLSALMVLVALICTGAGTWQILRFESKVRDNDALTTNAAKPAVPVAQLLPLVGHDHVSADAVRYRVVTASGRYDAAHQLLVRLRSVDGQDGSLLLTPLVTPNGTLLVVRGLFHPVLDSNAAPPPAPAGRVTVHARVQASETDLDGTLSPGQTSVRSINAAAQQARLGGRVYDGYAELLPGQPGTRYLVAIPAPDLSNPAGGAVEPQHFAYIVQWYLFAVLALAAPFAMIRSDRRQRDAAVPPPPPAAAAAQSPDAGASPPSDEQRRMAKLSDRYGR